MFFACNYYGGIATTSNAVFFRSLWNKSALYSSNFHRKLFKVVCIFKTCLSSILTTQILLRDWRELFWVIVLVVGKIRKMSRSYLQNLSLVSLKRSILETVSDIAKSSRQSLKKATEITLLHRLDWNLAWEDLNRTGKIVYHRAVLCQLLTIHFQLVMCAAPHVHAAGIP